MESISSVCIVDILGLVVEVGAPEARALVARGAVSTNQLLGTQRTSKLTQSCLQNVSKLSQSCFSEHSTAAWNAADFKVTIQLIGDRDYASGDKG